MRTNAQRRSQRRTPSALPLDSTSSRPKASSTERQWRLALSADDLRSLLAKNGIETVLMGAHAANRYRLEARQTVDVDFLASTLDGAAETLRRAGCVVRIAGRPRDIDDIRSILSTGIAVDRHFVEDNARQWDVISRWSDLLEER